MTGPLETVAIAKCWVLTSGKDRSVLCDRVCVCVCRGGKSESPFLCQIYQRADSNQPKGRTAPTQDPPTRQRKVIDHMSCVHLYLNPNTHHTCTNMDSGSRVMLKMFLRKVLLETRSSLPILARKVEIYFLKIALIQPMKLWLKLKRTRLGKKTITVNWQSDLKRSERTQSKWRQKGCGVSSAWWTMMEERRGERGAPGCLSSGSEIHIFTHPQETSSEPEQSSVREAKVTSRASRFQQTSWSVAWH